LGPHKAIHNTLVLWIALCGVCLKKSEPILQKIPTNETETMRTKFCGNYFLGKGLRKTSADSFFLNSDVASGGGRSAMRKSQAFL